MEGIYGVALLSASVLLLAFAARLRNGPNAPAWTQPAYFVHTVLFTMLSGIVFGISMLFDFVMKVQKTGFGLVETGLLLAVVVATWICWRAVRAMPAAIAANDPVGDMPPPANANGRQQRTGRKTGHGARKAA